MLFQSVLDSEDELLNTHSAYSIDINTFDPSGRFFTENLSEEEIEESLKVIDEIFNE